MKTLLKFTKNAATDASEEESEDLTPKLYRYQSLITNIYLWFI
jgi:hypothetical protein